MDMYGDGSLILFVKVYYLFIFFFFFQAEDGIRDWSVTGVQTCALPIWQKGGVVPSGAPPAASGLYYLALCGPPRGERRARLTYPSILGASPPPSV